MTNKTPKEVGGGRGVSGVKIDLENWMGQLPEPLTKMPLIHISIPGSHNSFTYSISSEGEVSPDSPDFVQSLSKWFGPISKRIIFNWSQGQRIDVIHQLKSGIRYYDVRVVLKASEIVIAHGLYGGIIRGFIEQINAFLDSHQREVVILDFQHFYEFTTQDHQSLLSMLLRIFGSKICRRHRRMRENTLENLWKLNNQVLIIYRHQMYSFHDIVWPSLTWTTHWPNKINVRELIECLNQGLTKRRDEFGFVSQGVLTPTPKYVSTHVFGSLRSLASRHNQKIISWLETKTNGASGINVIICDFIENYNFCERVILLNYKGCPSKVHTEEPDDQLEGNVNQNQEVAS